MIIYIYIYIRRGVEILEISKLIGDCTVLAVRFLKMNVIFRLSN